jgi:hypothetical protein
MIRRGPERNLALAAEDRFHLMLAMGERQLGFFMTANGLTRDQALRRIEQARQRGRHTSACMERVIDASRPDRPQDPR